MSNAILIQPFILCFRIPHNTLCLPPKFCVNHCFQRSWKYCIFPRAFEDNNLCKIFGGGGKQSVLWGVRKQSLGLVFYYNLNTLFLYHLCVFVTSVKIDSLKNLSMISIIEQFWRGNGASHSFIHFYWLIQIYNLFSHCLQIAKASLDGQCLYKKQNKHSKLYSIHK